MNENDRAAKIEAVAKAMWYVGRERYKSVVDLGEWVDADPPQQRDLMEDAAAALDALAPWSLDALLDSFSYMECGYDHNDQSFWANLWLRDDPLIEQEGTGPTRMDALRDAVARSAKGAGNE